MPMTGRLGVLAEARVDGRLVGVARILLGVATLLLAVEEAVTLTRVLDGSAPSLPIAGWMHRMPADGVTAYFLLWCVMAVFLIIGWHARLAGVVLAALLAYPLLLDQQTYSNHLYLALLAVVLLTLSNPGARLSIDARLGRADPTSPWWSVLLATCQLSIVYGYAAVAKLNGDYLSGDILEDSLTESAMLRLPSALLDQQALQVLAVAAIAAEAFLAVGFWSRRLRLPALVVGAGLHLGIIVLFPAGFVLELSAFAFTMFALYALAWTRRIDVGLDTPSLVPREGGSTSKPTGSTGEEAGSTGEGGQTSAPSSQGSRGVRGMEKTR